jgi:hypothetical protein
MEKFNYPRLILESGHLRVEEPRNWIQRKVEGMF